jgi:hypothetical protein
VGTELSFHKSVFLDCSCLPLKNCDELFRSSGVQWVEDGNVAAIIVKSQSLPRENRQRITELIVQKENRE